MNVPYNDKVHLDDMPPVDGNLGDLIIISLHRILIKGPPQIESFHKIITGIICNM